MESARGQSTGNPAPRITFENFLGQGRVNQLGGVFINGRPLPHEKRIQIVEMARKGVKPCKISRELKVSHGAVSKILNRFHETGSISPGQIGGNPRQRLSIQAVRQHILRLREEYPAQSAAQIQQTLVQRGICSRQNVPSSSRINRLLKAQKQSRTRKLEAKSEREVGAGAAGTNRPLSHSIENILGTALEEDPKGAEGRNSLSSTSPLSSGTTASSQSLQQIASGSDEENQHQGNGHSASLLQESRRARTSFSSEQLRMLERTFAQSPYPDQRQKEWLIRATRLDEDKIITWFSNRRARNRRKAIQQYPSPQHLLSLAAADVGMLAPAPPPAVPQPQSHQPDQSIFPAAGQLFPFPAFLPALLSQAMGGTFGLYPEENGGGGRMST